MFRSEANIGLEDAKTLMVIASVIGAAAGTFYISVLRPLDNYFIFVGLFILIGVCVANLVLLAVYELYLWLKRVDAGSENVQKTSNSIPCAT